jgi:hypothetical protein
MEERFKYSSNRETKEQRLERLISEASQTQNVKMLIGSNISIETLRNELSRIKPHHFENDIFINKYTSYLQAILSLSSFEAEKTMQRDTESANFLRLSICLSLFLAILTNQNIEYLEYNNDVLNSALIFYNLISIANFLGQRVSSQSKIGNLTRIKNLFYK